MQFNYNYYKILKSSIIKMKILLINKINILEQ